MITNDPAAYDAVKTLWRSPETLTLYGIPHRMRPGQSPRDLYDADRTGDWLYLGEPGWWGDLDHDARDLAYAFVAKCRKLDMVPDRAGEWSDLEDAP